MRRLNSVKSRTKFVAAAILSAAMLAFVGDASAAKETGTVVHMCVRQGVLPAREDVSRELLLHGNGVR